MKRYFVSARLTSTAPCPAAVATPRSEALMAAKITNGRSFICGPVLKNSADAAQSTTGVPAIADAQRSIKALVLSAFVSQNLVMLLARRSKEDLSIMHQLMEAGKVTPVIDRRYRLSEVPQAIRYMEEGHARGKVVITLE